MLPYSMVLHCNDRGVIVSSSRSVSPGVRVEVRVHWMGKGKPEYLGLHCTCAVRRDLRAHYGSRRWACDADACGTLRGRSIHKAGPNG